MSSVHRSTLVAEHNSSGFTVFVLRHYPNGGQNRLWSSMGRGSPHCPEKQGGVGAGNPIYVRPTTSIHNVHLPLAFVLKRATLGVCNTSASVLRPISLLRTLSGSTQRVGFGTPKCATGVDSDIHYL